MTKRQKKKINKLLYSSILLITLLLLNNTGFLNNNTDNNTKENVVVEKDKVTLESCIDGDTAKFNIDGQVKKVRFLAIDTPETVHPYKDEEEYGKSASEYTCNLLKSANNIQLEYEPTSSKTDKYDRLLAWVWLDNNLLQEQLIKIGYAKVRYIYGKYLYTDKLIELEKIAKQEKNGLWYDYEETIYNSKKQYKITFKYNGNKKVIMVDEGKYIPLIENPQKNNYEFVGWKKDGNLYDTYEPITRNVVLTASYKK